MLEEDLVCGYPMLITPLCGGAGVEVAVVAMAAAAWEVRNAASLTFTALITRMLGFRNLIKVHIAPPPPPARNCPPPSQPTSQMPPAPQMHVPPTHPCMFRNPVQVHTHHLHSSKITSASTDLQVGVLTSYSTNQLPPPPPAPRFLPHPSLPAFIKKHVMLVCPHAFSNLHTGVGPWP